MSELKASYDRQSAELVELRALQCEREYELMGEIEELQARVEQLSFQLEDLISEERRSKEQAGTGETASCGMALEEAPKMIKDDSTAVLREDMESRHLLEDNMSHVEESLALRAELEAMEKRCELSESELFALRQAFESQFVELGMVKMELNELRDNSFSSPPQYVEEDYADTNASATIPDSLAFTLDISVASEPFEPTHSLDASTPDRKTPLDDTKADDCAEEELPDTCTSQFMQASSPEPAAPPDPLGEMTRQVSTLTAEVEELRREVASREAAVQELQGQLEGLESIRQEALLREATNVTKSQSHLASVQRELADALAALEEERTRREVSQSSLEGEVCRLQALLDESDAVNSRSMMDERAQFDLQSKELRECRIELQRLADRQVGAQSSREDELLAEIEELGGRCEELEALVTELKSYSAPQDNISSIKDLSFSGSLLGGISSMLDMAEMASLEVKLSETEDRLGNMESRLRASEEEKEEALQRVVQLQASLEMLQERVDKNSSLSKNDAAKKDAGKRDGASSKVKGRDPVILALEKKVSDLLEDVYASAVREGDLRSEIARLQELNGRL